MSDREQRGHSSVQERAKHERVRAKHESVRAKHDGERAIGKRERAKHEIEGYTLGRELSMRKGYA